MSHIKDMETALCRHPEDPDPSVMQLEKYWHPKFNWYGPAGIGTSRGIAGFRHWHQIPFARHADRKVDPTGDRLAPSKCMICILIISPKVPMFVKQAGQI